MNLPACCMATTPTTTTTTTTTTITTTTTPPPPPQVDDKRLLVFGGLNKRTRYSDAWLYSTHSKEWAQLKVQGPCPEPRAHFTATKVGAQVYVFGGYGGCGAVFNDLWVLAPSADGASFTWTDLSGRLQGTGPSPRFDHTARVFPAMPGGSMRLVLAGGRDLSAMLHDTFVLDLESLCWLRADVALALPSNVCNNVCECVPSVPHYKVFSFGGKKGMMSYASTVEVLDCGSQVWGTPPVVDASKGPCGRCGCVWGDAFACAVQCGA
jgi:dynein heavy chain